VSSNTSQKLPTRVLDVASNRDIVFLCESTRQKDKYIALSHTWGTTHRLTLTTSNLAALKDGVLLSQLPKTFRDAAEIARQLKISYVWIDSLCIIQDDPTDWEVEASRMGDVYANSYLSIAALSSKDDSSGCFPRFPDRYEEEYVSVDVTSTGRRYLDWAAPVANWNRDDGHPTLAARCCFAVEDVADGNGDVTWIYLSPEWMPPSTKTRPQKYSPGAFGGLFDPIAEEPLSERGWALQERLLSPRTIHYGRTQMYWECQMAVLAEDGAVLPRTFTSAKELWEPSPLDFPKRHSLRWQRLVMEYSTRKLTRDTDKLPALSGLARLVANKTNDAYVAGLWKSNLLHELYWNVMAYEPTHMCDDPEHDAAMPRPSRSAVVYPTEYRAPSWSWASIDAQISYLSPLSDQLITTCVGLGLKPLGKDMFGRVAPGALKLKVCFLELSKESLA
jgi:hypothetical protein